MSFVEQEDVLEVFEGLISHLFKEVRGVDIPKLEKMTWMDAMEQYGCDKPDLRFGMKIVDLTAVAKGKDFAVFNDAEYIEATCAISKCVPDIPVNNRMMLINSANACKSAKGLVYVKYNEDGTFKSSVDKFYTEADLKVWAETCKAEPGDLILTSPKFKTLPQLCELRLEMGNRLGLRDMAFQTVVGSRLSLAGMGRGNPTFLRNAPPVHFSQARGYSINGYRPG